ncbi:isochorismatase family protein [bacterium]|nr:isochorismatase family protein [bacterium]
MCDAHLLDLCDADNAVLLVIDPQGKIFRMAFNTDVLALMINKVMKVADLYGLPVVLTEQYPKGLGPTVSEVREVYDALATEKHFFEKNYFGCCGEPGFNELIAELADKVRAKRAGDPNRPVDIIVVGIETQVCVQQTVLELLKQGYRVVVLEDCTGSRVKQYHEIAIKRFRQCGAIISNFESLSFEWTRTKDNQCFKAMSNIVKEGL